MPRKTKREKIIAQYRRKLELLKNIPLNSTAHTNTKSESKTQNLNTNNSSLKKDYSLDKNDQKNISKEEEMEIKKHFLYDLKKSLFLSFLIIGFEIALVVLKIVK